MTLLRVARFNKIPFYQLSALMRFVKKNKKAVKVEGKPIVAQEIEPKEVKEVDLHSLSSGKKKKISSLYLLALEDILRISSLLFQSPQARTS